MPHYRMLSTSRVPTVGFVGQVGVIGLTHMEMDASYY